MSTINKQKEPRDNAKTQQFNRDIVASRYWEVIKRILGANVPFMENRIFRISILTLWLFIAITIGSTGCNYLTSPTPIEKLPDWVLSEWEIGQGYLIEQLCYPEHKVWGVHAEYFSWKYTEDYFSCGGKDANGCFSIPKTITINLKTKTAARHETMHAILYRIDNKNWKRPQHDIGFRGMCGNY